MLRETTSYLFFKGLWLGKHGESSYNYEKSPLMEGASELIT